MNWFWDTLGALFVVIIAVFWLFEKTGFSKEDYKVAFYILVVLGIIFIAFFALAMLGVFKPPI
tara:strand:- start:38 stop:226 length:189 start_codon:yes stop_codon:yes gene_type:complete